MPGALSRGAPALAAMLAIGACLAPSASASAPLKAPKSLKGPYRDYVLTYDATSNSQGSATESWPQNPCGAPTASYQGTVTLRARATYRLLFGRRRGALAYVWRLDSHSVTGRATFGENKSVPGGCGDPGWALGNRSCQAPVVESESWDFQPGLGQLTVVPTLGLDDGSATCSGQENLDGHGSDDLRAGFTHFSPSGADTGAINVEPFPAEAVVPYSTRGLMARKTFRSGRVPTYPDHIHFGQGTDPSDESPGQQSTWSFNTGVRGAITLTPAKPPVSRRRRPAPARR